MADHARSDDPGVQAQLDRFAQLSPGRDILGLERIAALLSALGNPHHALPPVFHVAGTNGKGSTCAFLRAALEASGYTVHAYTSPHLVRFNERIRVAGRLISDAELAPLLREVLDAAERDAIGPSFFEATTAAAFLAFARTPADAAIIEVGLGGRLDATNVIATPLVCGIAQLGVDHQSFLGDDAVIIAGEKAGIAKPGVPLVTMAYARGETERIGEIASAAGAPLLRRGKDWDAVIYQNQLHYRDAQGLVTTALPRLAGAHQAGNAALAFAMLRHQSILAIPESALRAAPGWVEWPARLQRLMPGPLHDLLPEGAQLWLDGCHNPAAATYVAEAIAKLRAPGQQLHIIAGILANKDAEAILAPFWSELTSFHAVPVGAHEHHAPAALAAFATAQGVRAATAPDVATALSSIATSAPDDALVLVMGSLYLAGEVLGGNLQLPE